MSGAGRTRSVADGGKKKGGAGTKRTRKKKGEGIGRRFSTPGTDCLADTEYERRRAEITARDGSVVFSMEDIEVPRDWSQLATDIVASKYFRKAGVPGAGRETSVRDLIGRVVRTIRAAGEDQGHYFSGIKEAESFEAELASLLITQRGAFNSPVWFNCGLWHEYGIDGSGGNFAWDAETDTFVRTSDAYSRPQSSACFIQSVSDDLMSIFQLAQNEARLFKYGSGTGTNFSALRGSREMLSGGGTSSGLMSFLEVLDRAAGATKSGGTTRRAAKMVCLDMDHPEIESFIDWKMKEEEKARILIEGGMDPDFNGEAYHTISGQNSNNSVRVTDEFMRAVEDDGSWTTRMRTTGETCDTYSARDLMDRVTHSAWACADPGMQFDSAINRWHTCKASGRINASNPCSEYMFLDDSACNLASLNLLKFLDEDGILDVEGIRHAVRVFITAQDILVDLGSYPTEAIARNSHEYRPLGLGYANLGSLLMVLGLPYDSEKGRAVAAAVTAIMTGHAYHVSAELARRKSAFKEYRKNATSMDDVIRMHRDHVGDIADCCPEYLLTAAREDWDRAVAAGDAHGYRNAQVSVLAPTGTIGFLMDCDTTGVEPDFALVKFKKLAGGGNLKIVNGSVPEALRRLGYTENQIADIELYIRGTMTLKGGPGINRESLREKGLSEEDLKSADDALPGSFDLEGAVSPGTLGADSMARMGIPEERYTKPGFSLLRELGFPRTVIDHAGEVICGRMTVEGAPHLRDRHLPVFDCASRCGKKGKRLIEPGGHLRMMGAVQPFLSGAISKTVNVPNETTTEGIADLYRMGWEMGLKAVAIYRDGCKASQPLSASSGVVDESEDSDDAVRSVAHRVRLPRKRGGFTQEARVGGQKVYLRTGEYEDGQLGEIFIDMHKEGAAFRSMMNCFAISVSLGLQYGVPLEEFVDVFTFSRFEPQGHTDHPNVRFATSVVDFIFRVLAMEYHDRHDLVQVPPPGSCETAEGGPPQLEEAAPGEGAGPVEPAASVVASEGDSGSHGSGNGATKAGNGAESAGPARGEAVGMEAGMALQGVEGQIALLMKDAPFCDSCGHLTVRSGACYKCVNCGQSMGCS
ncbi:MAG: vitamin B12-dependent ribonucleotide reductase [Gemmatimonadota bacterium]|jgi:ribonucleoside-diphosphate reductase alpha chain|nr:vitamin B12-dependent ribonucleotide reductase [Gemmatimonadota bacterium]MDP6802878.1 vitamin B12-dependent ribonucleotide reductase [Gemmatimonadota bacterium]MDP7032176.1 vitamin B12-dependent ribonucleotide reductase [Gemmatimonadota bacterium]